MISIYWVFTVIFTSTIQFNLPFNPKRTKIFSVMMEILILRDLIAHFPWHCCRVTVASWNESGSVPSSSIFFRKFEMNKCLLFSKCCVEFTVKPSGPGLLFVGRFLITVSISLLVNLLFIILFLPDSVLDGCTFLKICPFLSCCPFYSFTVVVVFFVFLQCQL